jgi:galactokinase
MPAATRDASFEPPQPDELERQFRAQFGDFGGPSGGRRVFARAPGRVNLIGEHTDYSEGFVLPCAIDRHTWALARRRDDSRVRIFTRERAAAAEFELGALRRQGDWADYARAVFATLAEAGHDLGGVDLALASNLPAESGLSSSAAFGLAVATALDGLFGLEMPALERARIVHRAENHFVGVGCGILDQFASALGRRDHALRIDCRSQQVEPVPLPAGLRILIAHSGVTRALARGDYRDRVEECARAITAARDAGLAAAGATLRDLSEGDLPALEAALDPVSLRRARHVISENARVDAFCRALADADTRRLGELLAAGQRSLREDFEVSIPELDFLCECANQLPGVVGSRLTGAGFGGCTVHLVSREFGADEREALRAAFDERFGHVPAVWLAEASDGARLIDETER